MRIGIDFGGTKTEVIGINSRNGKELYRQRIPTKKDDYEGQIKNFVDLVLMAEEATGQAGTVGMAMPGSLSPKDGTVRNSNALFMNGKPLKQDLEKALGREVRIENDANCFVVSEATDGAARGKDCVFGAIIGTGCGGGFFINGKLVRGVNAIGGEWGHNPLPFPRVYTPDGLQDDMFTRGRGDQKDGRPEYITDDISWAEYPGEVSYCGRRGMMEEWVSGTGLKMDYHRVTGEDMSTHDIVENANRGEEKALAAMERYCDRLARGLAYVMNMVDPDTIVLGGGMSNVNYIYKRVPELWGNYVFSDVILTELKPPRHGDSSGVRGAAWLWPKEA
jgi:predicted NBD/HSP70 family sugar kinase